MANGGSAVDARSSGSSWDGEAEGGDDANIIEEAQPWERIRHNARRQREQHAEAVRDAFSSFWLQAKSMWRGAGRRAGEAIGAGELPTGEALVAARAELQADLVRQTLRRKELEREVATYRRSQRHGSGR